MTDLDPYHSQGQPKPTREQRRAFRKAAAVEDVEEPLAVGKPTPPEVLARWSRRMYHPGYVRGGMVFFIMGLIGWGTVSLLGLNLPPMELVLNGSIFSSVGGLEGWAIFSRPPIHETNVKEFKRRYSTRIAFRSLLFLLALIGACAWTWATMGRVWILTTSAGCE